MERSTPGEALEHATYRKGETRMFGHREMLAHHIAAYLCRRLGIDHAVERTGENILGIAHQYLLREDVEEAAVCQQDVDGKGVAVLQITLILADVHYSCRSLNKRRILLDARGSGSGCLGELKRLLSTVASHRSLF